MQPGNAKCLTRIDLATEAFADAPLRPQRDQRDQRDRGVSR